MWIFSVFINVVAYRWIENDLYQLTTNPEGKLGSF
jgi:hypothetical protein